MNFSQQYPRPHKQTAGRVYDGEAVLVLADTSEINVLNEVGSRIFEMADGQHSVADIIATVVDEFDVSNEKAAQDVQEFLDAMVEENVLTYASGEN